MAIEIKLENDSTVKSIDVSERIRGKRREVIFDIPECDEELIGYFIDEKCPKCGATLLGNKVGDKWCSYVGGMSSPACDYGIKD